MRSSLSAPDGFDFGDGRTSLISGFKSPRGTSQSVGGHVDAETPVSPFTKANLTKGVSPVVCETKKSLEIRLLSIQKDLAVPEKDWQTRVVALRSLMGLCKSGSLQGNSSCLSQLKPGLAAQITSARSVLVKEGCKAVALLAIALRGECASLIDSLVSSLIKPLKVTVEVIRDSAAYALLAVVDSCPLTKGVAKLVQASAHEDHKFLRYQCTIFVLKILENRALFSEKLLGKYTDKILSSIGANLADSHAEIKGLARRCLLAADLRWPRKVAKIFNSMDRRELRFVDEVRHTYRPVDHSSSGRAEQDEEAVARKNSMRRSTTALETKKERKQAGRSNREVDSSLLQRRSGNRRVSDMMQDLEINVSSRNGSPVKQRKAARSGQGRAKTPRTPGTSAFTPMSARSSKSNATDLSLSERIDARIHNVESLLARGPDFSSGIDGRLREAAKSSALRVLYATGEAAASDGGLGGDSVLAAVEHVVASKCVSVGVAAGRRAIAQKRSQAKVTAQDEGAAVAEAAAVSAKTAAAAAETAAKRAKGAHGAQKVAAAARRSAEHTAHLARSGTADAVSKISESPVRREATPTGIVRGRKSKRDSMGSSAASQASSFVMRTSVAPSTRDESAGPSIERTRSLATVAPALHAPRSSAKGRRHWEKVRRRVAGAVMARARARGRWREIQLHSEELLTDKYREQLTEAEAALEREIKLLKRAAFAFRMQRDARADESLEQLQSACALLIEQGMRGDLSLRPMELYKKLVAADPTVRDMINKLQIKNVLLDAQQKRDELVSSQKMQTR